MKTFARIVSGGPALLLLAMITGHGFGDTATSESATPTFDIPALIHKSIDEVRRALGKPDDRQFEPSDAQLKLGVDRWDNTFTKDGSKLLVTFNPGSRAVIDIFLGGESKVSLMKQGNLKEADSAYRLDTVKALKDPTRITGVKVIPIPISRAVAGDVPPHVKAYVRESQRRQRVVIDMWQERLAKTKAARLATTKKRKALDDIQARLEKTKSNPPMPEMDCLEITDKSIGKLGAKKITILQILDKDRMLLVPEKRVVTGINPPLLEYTNKTGAAFMFKGKSTAGLADNQEIAIEEPLMVVGTETYTTTIGARRTVFVLSQVSPELLKAARKSLLDDEFRTWTDSTGKFRIEARFIEFRRGNVVLHKKDDSEISIPSSKLSSGDRQWVQDKLKPPEPKSPVGR